jgi:hypothetical protein
MKGNIQHSTFNAQRPTRRCTRRFIGYRQAGLRLLNVGCWMFLSIALFASSLPAQTSSKNMLPPLAPAYGEIPPTTYDEIATTFWEQHRTAVLVGGFVFIALVGLIFWVIFRPKPPVIVPPEVQACEALAGLLRQPEDGKILSEVSQILRCYLIAVFELPATELTTAEICMALASQEKVDAEFARSISDFFRKCDERKFSRESDATPFMAAARALELVAHTESRHAEFRGSAAQNAPPR